MIKLMLVDEYTVFRKGLAILLKDNYSEFDIVGEASTGDEALINAEKLKPDVVIMNIYMHNSEGLDIVRLIHQKFPDIKILVLSLSEESDDLFRSLKAGASAYVSSTTDLKELSDSIRSVAAGESVLSPPLVSKLINEFRNGSSDKNQYLYILTRREREVLTLAAHGFSNKEIAEQCFISLTTVKAHFRNILGKLEVKNRTGAVALANSYGLLSDPSTSSSLKSPWAAPKSPETVSEKRSLIV